MVVKLGPAALPWYFAFESRVVLDGSQTCAKDEKAANSFESRVVLDGSQTEEAIEAMSWEFESRVVLDGSQTSLSPGLSSIGLRVVLF